MSKKLGLLVALGVAAVLAGCGGHSGDGAAVESGAAAGQAAGGGSGSGSGGAAGNVVAEGAWHSQQSNGDVLDLLLLENGTVYALSVGSNLPAPLLAFDQGSYTISADKMSAQLIHYNDLGTTIGGSATGTVVQGLSITGTATTNGNPNPAAFSVKPTSAFDSSYNYSSAASLSTIEGAWTSGYLLKQSSALFFTIDATTGALAGTNLGCSFTGTFVPRASGKNVFDVSLSFGQSPCADPGKTASGVAISYIASNGKRQLTAALQDATKTFGTMLYAQR